MRHIALHGTLPVIGGAGDTHEAVQAPLVYVLDAIVYRCAALVGLDPFLAVRVAGAAWLLALLLVCDRLMRLARPDLPPRATLLGALVATGTPIMLAVSSSVQNDTASIALALTALFLCLTGDRGTRRAALIGAVAGAALLAKVTVLPVVLGIILVVLIRGGGRRAAAVMLASTAAVFAWWPVHNLVVYGEPLGSDAARRAGYDFPAQGWHGISTMAHLTRSAITFLWIPVEYWRNEIAAPLWVEVVVVAATVAVFLGAWWALGRLNLASVALVSVGLASVAAWVLMTLFVEGASFRLAYACLPAWGLLAAAAAGRFPRTVTASYVGALLLLHVWTLTSMGDLHPLPVG